MHSGISSILTTVYIKGLPVVDEIRWSLKGPILQKTRELSEDTYYLMKEKIVPVHGGESQRIPLDEPVHVYLKPEFIEWKPYVKQSNKPDTMYPPSTDGWARRMVDRTLMGAYAVQKIKDSHGYWLTILDKQARIHESHKIEPYEIPVIMLKEDWESALQYWQRLLETNPQQEYHNLAKILDSSPPSWKELGMLLRGANIDNIEIRENMRDTLDQLVPKSFPEETRVELMAFLAWILRGKVLEKDPVKFFYELASAQWFRSLGIMHLKCLLENKPPPPYVKILQDAEQLISTFSYLTRDHSLRNKIELLILDKTEQYIPDYREYAFKYMRNQGRRERVRVAPPISSADARTSRALRRDRLALLYKGFSLKTTINPQAIGLTAIVSLSPAYRWPHNHMAWSATVEGNVRNLRHIQYMLVPPSIVETVNRAIGNIVEIEWNAKRVNKNLFRTKSGKWAIRHARIEKSLHESSSLSQLRREFGGWNERSISNLTREEAKVIDMTASNFFQFLTELDNFQHVVGITKERLEEILNDLHKRNVIGIVYRCMLWQLASIVFDITGPPEKVYSLTRGILKHTPTALGMTKKDGGRAIIIAKIPVDELHFFLHQFPDITLNEGLTLRTARVITYRSYQSTLLQRLLLPDGSWNKDVSMLLRQSYQYRQS
ncbi:MAG: hypothetical protein K9W43_04615 [Candidatus Thorarchaeota archaeon]|nr:hypothetical protein [Candidatus Thorarchaeota archaeon]